MLMTLEPALTAALDDEYRARATALEAQREDKALYERFMGAAAGPQGHAVLAPRGRPCSGPGGRRPSTSRKP
jgi:hypothetical protein